MESRAKGVMLHHEVRGDGPPVLLVHGFPLRGSLWDKVAGELGDGYRLIVPDLRGHGASPATREASMRDYAEDLAALLDQLGETRPVTIAGMSMGGYVALEFLRRFRDRVRALALVASRAAADSEEAARARRQTAERVLREGTGGVVEAMVDRLFAPGAPAGLPERWRAIMGATPPDGMAAALRAMAERIDSTATLRSARCPVLVVAGEQDPIVPLEEARAMAEASPRGRLVTIPGAGHMAPVERPREVAAALRTLLDEPW